MRGGGIQGAFRAAGGKFDIVITNMARAAVIHEAAQFGGYGAEVAARLSERHFFYLAAPILRVTGFDIPFPSPKLEEHHLPTAERVLAALDTWEW